MADGQKPLYRPLNIPERDLLFAYYEKHNGNMLAMTRDRECLFKAHSQIRYYAKLYFFAERLIAIKRKKADDVLNSLTDSKVEAIQRAVEMIRPRQVALKKSDGSTITDAEGKPVFEDVWPSHKEIKAAWEIIKTELGEPTTILKSESLVNNPQAQEINKALDVIATLAHAKPQDNGNPIPGERPAADNPAPVSAPVQHNSDEGTPAK